MDANHLAATVWRRKGHSNDSNGQDGMPPEEANPIQWNNRWSKPHADFKRNKSKVVLEPGMKKPPESVPTSVQGRIAIGRLGVHEGHLEVGMCWQLCEDGRITDAVDVLNFLVQRGSYVSKNIFYRILKRCIAHNDLVMGTRIHFLTVKGGYEGDRFLATHLITLYAAQRRLEDAMGVFTKVSIPDAYNWAAIIAAYAKHGEASLAISLYRQMRDSSAVKPTDRIYVAVVRACAVAGDFIAGKEVHADILVSQGKPNMFVQTGLVDMYAKCGSLGNARSLFDGLVQKDVVTWNVMIAGYAQQGMGQEALSLYRSMQLEDLITPSPVTFVLVLQACASIGVGALSEGKKLHAQIEERGLKCDMVLGGSLVNMYAKCCSLQDARRVFDRLRDRDIVTWTLMIAGYAQQGMGQEALRLHSSMQHEGISAPDSVTYMCLLQACASVGVEALQQGKQLHAQIEEQGLQHASGLRSSLVNMYAKCGSLEDAQSLFGKLPQKDVITWNSMIAGYAQQGMGQQALTLYSSMQQEGITPPDCFTFASLLQACGSVAALPLGMKLHAEIKERGLQSDLVVGAALVNMYAKCGNMIDSQQVFDSLPKRSMEAWNALTGGYTRQGESELVFALFDRMVLEGLRPDNITFLSVITVCSHVGLVNEGRKFFHAMTADYGISPSVELYRCMVDLLGRAGHLDEALQMAKSVPFPPDRIMWSTLLGACRKWDNVDIGQQAFKYALSVDGRHSASYVLMSNIYASAEMWEEAKEMQARRAKSGARKLPGQSWWTDMGGDVHTFVVGDK